MWLNRVMSIKCGDRVRFVGEGEVDAVGQHGRVRVVTDRSSWWADAAECQLVVQPLVVGDVVTDDSPEPPVGSLLTRGHRNEVALRTAVNWVVADTHDRVARVPWDRLYRSPAWTVLRVGAGS